METSKIDASLATISATGTGGLTNVGNAINTLTIVGGRIQNQIKNINTTTRNVFFDRRFAQNGFAPPWFPSTTVTLRFNHQQSRHNYRDARAMAEPELLLLITAGFSCLNGGPLQGPPFFLTLLLKQSAFPASSGP